MHQAEILEQVARGVPLDETLLDDRARARGPLPAVLVRDHAARRRRLDAAGRRRARRLAAALPRGARRHAGRGDRRARAARPRTSASRCTCATSTTDDRWAEHRDVAQAHGLHASWSIPILASDGERGARHARRVRRRAAPARRRAPADLLPARAARVDRDRAQGVRGTARAPVDARPAHRPAEPPAVPRPARPGDRALPAHEVERRRRCSSTSTASRTSTTASATTPATSCWSRSRASSSR